MTCISLNSRGISDVSYGWILIRSLSPPLDSSLPVLASSSPPSGRVACWYLFYNILRGLRCQRERASFPSSLAEIQGELWFGAVWVSCYSFWNSHCCVYVGGGDAGGRVQMEDSGQAWISCLLLRRPRRITREEGGLVPWRKRQWQRMPFCVLTQTLYIIQNFRRG